MNFTYNSYSLKKPFGAVPVCSSIEIIFPIHINVPVLSVNIIIREYHLSEGKAIPLDFINTQDDYHLYKCAFELKKAGIYMYRFEVLCEDGIWFIGRGEKGCAVRGDHLPEWQITVYKRAFSIPRDLIGGIVYHIFVDRFNRSGRTEFIKNGILKDWGEDVTIIEPDGSYLANDFFGGNLQGIIDKLDYLVSLGVTLIYLSPIFKSSSNHRYDTGDYLEIDELLGSEEVFDNLIIEADKRGIGIILDGVFNHSGADSIYFNKFSRYSSLGAFESKDSPYYDWFTFNKFPEKYNSWWGIEVVPTFNKSNEDYRRFLIDCVIDKWSNKGIRGWRLDVVDELPKELVDKIRDKVKSIDNNLLLIGEVWEDASVKVAYDELKPYFTECQLDGVMNYPVRSAIIDLVKNGNTAVFSERIMALYENYPKHNTDMSMTILGTHDTVRTVNELSEVTSSTKEERKFIRLEGEPLYKARKRLKVASVIQYMLPGLATIYYGDEIALEGYEDPINRRPFPWDNIDLDMLNHYKLLGGIRNKYKDIIGGGLRFIDDDNLLIFHRFIENRMIEVVINVSGRNQVFTNYRKDVNLLGGNIYEGANNLEDLQALILTTDEVKDEIRLQEDN